MYSILCVSMNMCAFVCVWVVKVLPSVHRRVAFPFYEPQRSDYWGSSGLLTGTWGSCLSCRQKQQPASISTFSVF